MDAETRPTTTESVKTGTTYVVLFRDDSGYWTDLVTIQASSSDDAVRRAVVKTANATGTYVAVPARSWKPVTVTVETSTKLKLT